MGKKATKTRDNIYYIARMNASETCEDFTSREKAAELLGIDRTRLARIELEKIIPYPEEVVLMSKAYNAPELLNHFCAHECACGKGNVQEVTIEDLDRLTLKVLGSLKDIDALRMSLIAISEDGIVEASEEKQFYSILDSLDKISNNAAALKIWAQKNIHIK